jgi:uncharacterized protein (TIGR02217 family)
MAQLATVLANDYLETMRGGPGYRTTIYDGATGYESRNQVWVYPRRSYDLTFIGLEDEVQSVIDLFEEAKGRAFSFLWTPLGGAEGSYRFGSDELRVETIARNGEAGDFILRVSTSVIEVIYA